MAVGLVHTVADEAEEALGRMFGVVGGGQAQPVLVGLAALQPLVELIAAGEGALHEVPGDGQQAQVLLRARGLILEESLDITTDLWTGEV